MYTKTQEFTRKREEAEENVVDKNLIWSNAAQKISNYALDSNMKAAKYKGKLYERMAMKQNWEMPQMYQQQQRYIQLSNSSARASELNDSQANVFHAAKKINRKNLF